MAITMTMVIPGTKEMYDGLNSEMGTNPSNLPDGLIAHYASVTPDGIRIFDVWESEAAWEKFASERLGPAVAKLTDGQGNADGELGQLHNSFTG
jgi:hypothetical protein